MKTRKLGTSALYLSAIGYGAWEASPHWGSDFDSTEIIAAVHAGIEVGINWVDTAEVYGPHISEEIVGVAVRGTDVMVATKVAPQPAGSGFRPDEIRKACEGSLARLQRDVIDLYQLHWPARDIGIEETWSAMATLQDEGLVRAIGVSNFSESLIAKCEGIRHVDSLQPHASLLHRDNCGLIAWCGERGIGTVPYGPLAYGLLTGTITKDTKFQEDDWRSGSRGFDLYEPFFSPANLERHVRTIEALRPIAARSGITLAQLAVAWLLHQPGVTSPIVGSRNPAHVRSNVAAADVSLDTETLAEIDGLLKREP